MGVYKVKNSPNWQYSFTIKGVRYRGSTGLCKREDAETFVASERRKIILGDLAGENSFTLSQAFAKYELEHAMFLSSYDRIQDHVNHLLAYFGKAVDITTITQNDMEKYIAECRREVYQPVVYSPKAGKMVPRGGKRLLKPATINRRVATFQGMYNKATKSWKIRMQPIDFPALKLKENNVIDNTLQRSSVQTLFDAAPKHLQHFIIITLFTGWRSGNVLTLNGRKQIDLERMVITTIGKGGKRIDSEITDAFRAYILANGLHESELVCDFWGNGRPLRSIHKAWNNLFDRTGIRRIRIHDLRHTFGTWLYEKTGDQRLVQEALHHSDIKTSVRYTHTRREVRRARLNDAIDLDIAQLKEVSK